MQTTSPSKWNLESDWVVVPKQARSFRSFEAILEAATELFTTRGFDGTSIQDISQTSGVSTGSIYNRFPDKDSILQVIHDSFSNAVIDNTSEHAFSPENWKNASAAEIVMALVDRFFFIFGSYTAISCLIERQRQVNPAVAQRAREWDEMSITKTWAMLADRRAEIPVRNAKETLTTVHYMLRESLALTMIFDAGELSPKFRIHDRKFKATMMRMALRCFGLPDDVSGWQQPVWDPLKGW